MGVEGWGWGVVDERGWGGAKGRGEWRVGVGVWRCGGEGVLLSLSVLKFYVWFAGNRVLRNCLLLHRVPYAFCNVRVMGWKWPVLLFFFSRRPPRSDCPMARNVRRQDRFLFLESLSSTDVEGLGREKPSAGGIPAFPTLSFPPVAVRGRLGVPKGPFVKLSQTKRSRRYCACVISHPRYSPSFLFVHRGRLMPSGQKG